MNRKAEVFRFVQSSGSPSNFYEAKAKWEEFQKTHPYIRIKLDSQKRILIRFSEGSQWVDPISWAMNYRANITERVNIAMREYFDLGEKDILFQIPDQLKDEVVRQRNVELKKIIAENFKKEHYDQLLKIFGIESQ